MIDTDFYRENGYLHLKRFFRRDEVDKIRQDAKQVFLAQMLRLGIITKGECAEDDFERGMYKLFDADLQSFINSGKQVQHLVSLHRLSLDERLIGTVRSLGLELPNISTRPIVYFNSRRLATKEAYWRLALHQDWRSMQGSLDALVVWVPLTDIDTTLGTIEIIPGSHKSGLLESEMIDGYGRINESVVGASPVPVEVEAGDALCFSAFLMHQSGTNRTDSIRWSCHFRYNNLREPTFVERGFPHPYIYKPQEALITAGFPTRVQVRDSFEK